MNSLTPLVLEFLLNSLWQIPMILCAGWLVSCALRPVGPKAEHRAWVIALIAEMSLPALSILPWQRLQFAWPWHANAVGDGQVVVAMGPGSPFGGLRMSGVFEAVLAVAYLAVVVYCALRFVWHFVRLSALRRAAVPMKLSGGTNFRGRGFASEEITLATSGRIFAPVTLGIRKKLVLLPEGLMDRLSPADFETALTHEFAHVRRNDFLKNVLYEIVTLPVSYHPAVWYTRQRMSETREMVCDEIAAEDAGREYAQSLLRLASLLLEGKRVQVPHAIGVFDSNTLERRLMRLTERKTEVGRTRRLAVAAACIVLGFATTVSAIAMRLGVDDPSANSSQTSHSPQVSVPAGKMAEMVVKKVMPKYPPEAKKARIQGKVELHAVIDKTGHVADLKVISGPNELQASATDAVRQWEYKPYLVNGNPVEVTTEINVIYSLAK